MAFTTNSNLKNQVIYQIFTRNYKGGTFREVQNDLERIQKLGVDIIYLLPIQPCGVKNRKGSLGSPYAIKDYRITDLSQGTMEDFIALCDAVHNRGMKIMIDIVYNHTSPDSVLATEHPEWFYHKPNGSMGNRIGDWWDVVDLDYSHPELWRYQIDTLKMWAQYVDGFRCDVAPLVPLEFWLQARAEVETVRPGCIWLAESIEPEFTVTNRANGIDSLSDSELYQAFDICYDHDVYYQMKHAILQKDSLSTYIDALNRQPGIYPANAIRLRFLENHDRPRAASLISDEQILRSWTAWMYVISGTVLIYAGQEFCVRHHPTLFDLDPVSFDTGSDISSFLQALYKVRQDPLFAECIPTVSVHGNEILYAVLKGIKGTSSEGRCAIGIFPLNHQDAVSVDLETGCYTNAITGKEIEVYETVMNTGGEPVIVFTDSEHCRLD